MAKSSGKKKTNKLSNIKNTICSINGAEKTRQLHVKNEIRIFFNTIHKNKLCICILPSLICLPHCPQSNAQNQNSSQANFKIVSCHKGSDYISLLPGRHLAQKHQNIYQMGWCQACQWGSCLHFLISYCIIPVISHF